MAACHKLMQERGHGAEMLPSPRFHGIMVPVLEGYSAWEQRQSLQRSARMSINDYQPLGDGSMLNGLPQYIIHKSQTEYSKTFHGAQYA